MHITLWSSETLHSLVESIEELASILAVNSEVDGEETVLDVTGDTFAIVVERVSKVIMNVVTIIHYIFIE